MRVTLSLPRRATHADYLAVEQGSERRYELLDGVLVAVAGGSDERNAIAGRLTALFGARMPRGCLGYTSHQRFWIAATGRARYAEGSTICGNPAQPSHDAQATTDPVVVVEVLSPSSEGDDDGDKRRDFQSLESLQASADHVACMRWVPRQRGFDAACPCPCSATRARLMLQLPMPSAIQTMDAPLERLVQHVVETICTGDTAADRSRWR